MGNYNAADVIYRDSMARTVLRCQAHPGLAKFQLCKLSGELIRLAVLFGEKTRNILFANLR
jgi:hypothetical protein